MTKNSKPRRQSRNRDSDSVIFAPYKEEETEDLTEIFKKGIDERDLDDEIYWENDE